MLLPPVLKKLLESLRSERRAALDALRSDLQDLTRAVRDQQISDRQQREAHESALNLPERSFGAERPIRQHQQMEERTHRGIEMWLQMMLVVVTWLAFLAAVMYAGITAFQWRTMNDTYDKIRIQTEQMTQQTKLLRQQLSGTEGAVVRLAQGSPGMWNDGEVFWHLMNIGRVPATDARISATTMFLDVKSGKPIGTGPVLDKTYPTIAHTEDPNQVASGGPGEIAWYNVAVFTVPSAKWSEFSDTKLAVAIKGSVSYNNGFDRWETLPVCYYFFAYTIAVPDTYKRDVRIIPEQCTDGRTFERARARALCEIGIQRHTISNGPCPGAD